MNRRRVTVSPSKAPGISRSSVYLDLLLRVLVGHRGEQYRGADSGRRRGAARALVRIASSASGAPAQHELLGAPVRARSAPQPTARAPAAQTASASSRVARALRERAERDHVGQLGHGARVAERDQPREAERVQPVAGEQREIGLGRRARRAARRSAAGSPRRSPRPAARTPRAGPPRAGPRRRRAAGLAGSQRRRRRRRGDERRHQPALVAQQRAQALERARIACRPRRAAARARRARANAAGRRPRRVRSICSVAVRERREPGLELRRRRVDAAREQLAAPGARRRRGRSARASAKSATGRSLKNTVSRPGALTTCTGQPPRRASRSPSASRSVIAAEAQVGGLVEQLERRQPGGDRERVARQRARPGRPRRPARACSISSARPPTAAAGRPPPMTLPMIVRSARTPVQLLRAAAGDAEAADHLVEHEQRAARVGALAQQLEEARARRHEAHVGGQRLGDDRRQLVPLGRRDQRLAGRSTARRPSPRRRSPGTPGLDGQRLRGQARAGLGEQAVDVAVVGARELQHRARGRWPRARAGSRSSSPRCPRRSCAASRRAAIARARPPRRARPRPRSARRSSCPRAAAAAIAASTRGWACPWISGPHEQT